MRKAWDPHQPVETLFKQIQDCVDYAESGGITISEAQKLSTIYIPMFSPQATSIVRVAVGMKEMPLTRLGTTSRSIFRWSTVSTSKSGVNQLIHPGM
jgi:hypothetical protein